MTVPTGATGIVLTGPVETAPGAAPEDNSYRWAAVTALSPLRVKLDGENLALPITPESLVPARTLRVGTRVWVQLYGRRVVILGASGGGVDVVVPVGGIVEYGGATAPDADWLMCDGTSYLRTAQPELFAKIGTTYGAVDGTHFNVPDHRNRVGIGASTTYALGATGGASTVTLAEANLPAHTHTASVNLSTGTVGNESSHTHNLNGSGATASSVSDHSHPTGLPSMGALGVVADGATSYAQVGSGSTSGAGGHSHNLSGASQAGSSHTHTLSGTINATVGSVGSGTAHDNMQPYVAVNFIIRAR